MLASLTCHPHVYPQVELAIPAFAPQPQSVTALERVLISRPAEGSRLSWPCFLWPIMSAVLYQSKVTQTDLQQSVSVGNRNQTTRTENGDAFRIENYALNWRVKLVMLLVLGRDGVSRYRFAAVHLVRIPSIER